MAVKRIRWKLLLAGGFLLCFLLLILTTELNRDMPKRIFTTKHSRRTKKLKHSPTTNSSNPKRWKSIYKISNTEVINEIVKEEILELRKLGVELNVGIDVKIETSSATTENSAKKSEVNDTAMTVTPRLIHAHAPISSLNITNSKDVFKTVRTPEPSVLKTLTEDEIAVEKATDPLPFSTYCEREVFLLILVISQPSSFKRRNNIRDSWAFSYRDDYLKLKNRKYFPDKKTYIPKNVVKTVFVVGNAKGDSALMAKVKEESEFTKDVVFGDLTENYRNLTLKTKLALKFAAYGCRSTFVIKTDDDVFINPVVLVEWLKGMPQENLYTGWCNFNSPVVRNAKHKWYVSYEDYKEPRFPGYCLGGGYILSEDLLLKVVRKSYGRKIFPMEDIYVGLMVKELGVKPRDEKSHFNLVYSGRTVMECLLNNLFLAHQVLDDNLLNHIKQARSAMEKC